MTNHITTSN